MRLVTYREWVGEQPAVPAVHLAWERGRAVLPSGTMRVTLYAPTNNEGGGI